MNLLKTITSHKFLIILLYIFVHLILININVAEWGDSYRILRASEHIRNDFTYPLDEKRPPLYSIFLSIRPDFVEPIMWGRIFMFGLSLAFLYFYIKFINLKTKNNYVKNLSILLLLLNPVFLYWSIRIYADVFFAFIVLLNFYLFYKHIDNLNIKKIVLLALISALSVLTRFEGYLLFGSIGFGILTSNYLKIKKHNVKNIILLIKNNFLNSFVYLFSFLLFLLPWFIYKNPLNSSYFQEPTGRSYDLSMVITYVVSLLFMFGFTSAFSFFIFGYKRVLNISYKHLALSVFIFTELFLILLWPAAIPRLFVPIIPFITFLLAYFINNFINTKSSSKSNLYFVLVNIALLFIYVVGQYFFKLQFLINNKILFGVLILINFLAITSLYFKKYIVFTFITLVSVLFWSFSIIYLHKNNFISIKNIAEYASKNITGVVAYNDVSSVSDWYLNQTPNKINGLSGFYYNFESNSLLSKQNLLDKNIDYLLITNEHNPTLEIDLNKRPYLELIREYEYNLSGTIFRTSIVKIIK